LLLLPIDCPFSNVAQSFAAMIAYPNQRVLLVVYRLVNFDKRRIFQGFEYAVAVLGPA
jgi:hypothetical protein